MIGKQHIAIFLIGILIGGLGYHLMTMRFSTEYFSLKLEYKHKVMGINERLNYAVRDIIMINQSCYILSVYLWGGCRVYDVGEMFIDLALDNVTIASFSIHKRSIAPYRDHVTIVFNDPLYVHEGSVLTMSCSATSITMLEPHFVVKVLCKR